MVKLSLKYKFLSVLILIPAIGLGGYLYFSLNNFVKDKLNYVLESSTNFTSSQAELINTRISYGVYELREVADQYDPTMLKFNELARQNFKKQSSLVRAQIFEFKGQQRRDGELLDLQQGQIESSKIPFFKILEPLKVFYICHPDSLAKLSLVVRSHREKYQYIVAEMQIAELAALKDQDPQLTALNCPNNLEPGLVKYSSSFPSAISVADLDLLQSSRSFTQQANLGPELNFIISGTRIGETGLALVSALSVEEVMRPIRQMQVQAVFAFVSFFSLICVLALAAAGRLTASLNLLGEAASRLAQGDFKFEFSIPGSDEIAQLGATFRKMRSQILELLDRTKESARMEAELETATTVQKTLFPDSSFECKDYRIRGTFMTASECGGDLWYYLPRQDKVLLFIGDVVGHGVSSALMTTAARSITAVVKKQNIDDPAAILELLNHAIWETSKGQMWMTFFVAVIDLKSGELIYGNASHNSPMLFPHKSDGSFHKNDVQFLSQVSGSSLGRQADSTYTVFKSKISQGDLLFFFTDGLSECENQSGEQLGESRLLRGLSKSWAQSMDIDSLSESTLKIVEDFRQGTDLKDDLTFFAFQMSKSESQ
jgi:serine phosphatase RsbU (regulator of sigma subunit)